MSEREEPAANLSTTLDPVDWNGFRDQAHRMLDDMLGYTQTLRQRPVWQTIPSEVRDRFSEPLPAAPTDLAQIHEQFLTDILPYAAANAHPGFMGWVQGGGTPVGMLAEMLSAGLNANTGGRDQIPLDVERQLVTWMRTLFGFPETASGIVLTGTSMANLVAVLLTRNSALGPQARRAGLTGQPRLVAYASNAVHGSIPKALDLAGLGSSSLRTVSTDTIGRIDLLHLAHLIQEDRALGLTPFLVIGTAGTVDTGAIDDLDALATLCSAHKLWFHVDGALAALAILSPTLAPRLRGIERANSLAFDFHKWAQVPYDAGFLLVQDGQLHQQSFASSGAYLARETRGPSAGSVWPCDLGPELSRSFRALKIWMSLKVYGTDALAAVIDRTCALAASLGERIQAHPELELLAPVSLNIVCFAYRFPANTDALDHELILLLQESGLVCPSSTTLNGRTALRAAVVNHRTGPSDIDLLLETTLTLARELRARTLLADTTEWHKSPDLAVCQACLAELDHLLAHPIAPSLEIDLRLRRALLLTRFHRELDARTDHLRVLDLAPTHRVNLLELGRLLLASGNFQAAKVVYTEAVQHDPDDLFAQTNLAVALLKLDDMPAAHAQYSHVLAMSPELPEAHGGMFYVLQRMGQMQAAQFHQHKAFGPKHLFRTPYQGTGTPVSLLLLVSSTGGNTPLEKLLDPTVFETHTLVADFFRPGEPLPPHSLIVNGIGDPDAATPALRAAIAIVARSKAPILNLPEAVLASGRCDNAERLARLPGVLAARTRLYSTSILRSPGAAAELARDGFRFPLTVRAPGFHMGQHFERVESPAALPEALDRMPPSDTDPELLVLEYLDASASDGNFRKYRAMMIGGRLYPLHLAISRTWKIHYFSADMADRPDHRAEEQRFLEDMPGLLGPRAMAALERIQSTLALDYGGIDFGLSPTGDVLLFEANATMVVEQPADDPRWDYRRRAVSTIHEAVRRMLTRHQPVAARQREPVLSASPVVS